MRNIALITIIFLFSLTACITDSEKQDILDQIEQTGAVSSSLQSKVPESSIPQKEASSASQVQSSLNGQAPAPSSSQAPVSTPQVVESSSKAAGASSSFDDTIVIYTYENNDGNSSNGDYDENIRVWYVDDSDISKPHYGSSTPHEYPAENDANTPDLNLILEEEPYDTTGEYGDTGEDGEYWELPQYEYPDVGEPDGNVPQLPEMDIPSYEIPEISGPAFEIELPDSDWPPPAPY